jgi:DnaK suppressor protein
MNRDFDTPDHAKAAKRVLLQRRDELSALLGDAAAAAAQAADEPAHLYDFKDLAEDELQHTVHDQTLARAAHELADVAVALRRIDEGSYGMCAACGEAIDPARLRAIPSAYSCTRCQAEAERASAAQRSA